MREPVPARMQSSLAVPVRPRLARSIDRAGELASSAPPTANRQLAFGSGAHAPENPAGIRLVGRALAADERSYFEPRFGRSLDQVRVHDDAAAATSARSFGAAAYTYGHDVVLGAGLPSGSLARRSVLAHELAHTLQYSGTAPADRLEVGAPGAAAEHEAHLASQRVLAGQSASVSARDAAPVVRRVIPGPRCHGDELMPTISWKVKLAAVQALLTDPKFIPVRGSLLKEIKLAEVMIEAYLKCGRIKMVPAGPTLGLTTIAPPPVAQAPVPVVDPVPVVTPTPAPIVEPVPVVEPAPTPMAGPGAGVGPTVVVTIAIAGIQYGLSKWLAPTPEGTPVTADDINTILKQIDTDFQAAKQAADELASHTMIDPNKAKAPQPSPQTDVNADIDTDEKPDEDGPRSCDSKDTSCTPVPIPRKGGSSKYAKRHNRCADAVTDPAYKGKDVCVNGKAFDALDSEGVLWEIKAHAWSYADIYKDPKMASRIAGDIAGELLGELTIAKACGKKFKLGVRDPGMKAAIKKFLPGLVIEVLKC